MAEPTRQRLEEELARLHAQRRTMAGDLGGEDAADPDVAGRGDQSVQLEGEADLQRLDRRIAEIQHLLADLGDPALADTGPGLTDGTVVTLRFPDGDVTTLRVVTHVAEEAIPADAGGTAADEVLTADSPLGQALVGRGVGETVGYAGPDGDLQAEVLAIAPPA